MVVEMKIEFIFKAKGKKKKVFKTLNEAMLAKYDFDRACDDLCHSKIILRQEIVIYDTE